MATTLKDTLAQLESLGDEKVRAQNRKAGAGDDQFGVRLGDIRKLAAKIKSDDRLAIALWETGNVDAQFLAALLIEPKKLSAEAVDRMVRSTSFVRVADWLNSYVVAKHPDRESLREEWMDADDRWAARAGWHLTAVRVAKDPDGLDLRALLDRIESEMPDAAPEVQWTMNNTLAAVGIHVAEHRERAIADSSNACGRMIRRSTPSEVPPRMQVRRYEAFVPDPVAGVEFALDSRLAGWSLNRSSAPIEHAPIEQPCFGRRRS